MIHLNLMEYIGLRQIAKRMGWSANKVRYQALHFGFPLMFKTTRLNRQHRRPQYVTTDELIGQWHQAQVERTQEHLRSLTPRKPRPPTRSDPDAGNTPPSSTP